MAHSTAIDKRRSRLPCRGSAFHEKAGESQAFSLFFLSSSLFLLLPNCSHWAEPPLSPPFRDQLF